MTDVTLPAAPSTAPDDPCRDHHHSRPSTTVTIVFWEGYLGVAPSLVNAVHMLEEAGFRVEILAREPPSGFPERPVFSATTRVAVCRPWSSAWIERGLPGRIPTFERDIRSSARRRRGVIGRLRATASRCVGTALLLVDMLQFGAFVRRQTVDRRDRFWIGIDLLGLLAAAGQTRPGRLAYWSLEIVFGANLSNPVLRWLKVRERLASRRARFVIVQDAKRAELLVTENRLDRERIVLVPNAPRGVATEGSDGGIRARLGIPRHVRIVLHLGMIGPEVLSTEVAASTHGWPDDCMLVFHERRARQQTDPVVRDAARAAGDRVAFSLDPVALDQLPELVASADVGLVFYNPAMGANYSVIAGASGKLAYYLQAGLPVICLDLPGFRELLDQYGCGRFVSSPAEIGAALREVFADREQYRAGARRCFEEKFDFDRHFERFMHSIDRPETAS